MCPRPGPLQFLHDNKETQCKWILTTNPESWWVFWTRNHLNPRKKRPAWIPEGNQGRVGEPKKGSQDVCGGGLQDLAMYCFVLLLTISKQHYRFNTDGRPLKVWNTTPQWEYRKERPPLEFRGVCTNLALWRKRFCEGGETLLFGRDLSSKSTWHLPCFCMCFAQCWLKSPS